MQQAITKSRCSKGFNLRLRAVFCFAILLFADLERAGGEAIIAGPTSGPLYPMIHCAERLFQHVSKHSQHLSSLSRSKHSQQFSSLLRSKHASKVSCFPLTGKLAMDGMCMGTERADLAVCKLGV